MADILSKTQRSEGFTVVELIIVVAVLSILSALVVLRFVDLKSGAHKSVNDNIFASFKSAVVIAHTKWIVSGSPSTIIMEGVSVPMSSTGWPGATPPTTSICISAWNSLLNSSELAKSTFTIGDSGYYATAIGGICLFYYMKESVPSRYLFYRPDTGTVQIVNP